MDENSVSSPEVHYFRNYIKCRLKSIAPFAYDHEVRKKTRLLKKKEGVFSL